MGLTVQYTGTRVGGGGGGGRERNIFVSRTSTNYPCNLCIY